MSQVRVHNFSISLDGYAAGPGQGLAEPLGEGGEQLHDWMIATRAWRERTGQDGGTGGPDDAFARRFENGLGATIMGRNMFGPVRGEWPEASGGERWTGWWGPNPPYHHPVFVLTHHSHEPIEMEGGTTFHFVTDGIESALRQARQAAGGLDVAVGGGASTVRQYLRAGLIDHLHVAISPVVLGRGERLFDDVPNLADDYQVADVVHTGVTHVVMTRR